MSTQSPTVFALPEHAHDELVDVRNQLRLLARLTVSVTATRARWCFARLSRDLDAVLDATHAPDDAARPVPQPGH